MSVDEREEVPMPLHLLRLLRQPVLVQPPLRLELARVGAPELRRGVDVVDWDRDLLALGDCDVVGELAVGQTERPRERDDVILRRHALGHCERRVQTEDLVHDRVQVVQPGSVRELLPGRVRVRKLLLDFFSQAGLRLGFAAEVDEGPLR